MPSTTPSPALLRCAPTCAGRPPPPAPWHAWLLVALARQTVRQRWLMSIRRGPLRGVRRGEGDVPGMPGWRYEFHGIGLCLEAPDGETIDVDDRGDGGWTIDPYFFARRLQSLRLPALPEQRVRAYLPTDDVVAEAIRDLAAEGLVTLGASRHVFRVAPALEAAADALAAIDFADPAMCARWSVHLGDPDPDAAALREAYTRHLLAGRAAVERWARGHVLRGGYTWGEVLEANADGFLAHELEELQPWADAMRTVVEPDFDRVVRD